MRLLIHACCAPCSAGVIERLHEHELCLYFYNPNIHPEREYETRLADAERYARALALPFSKGAYDRKAWLESIRGLEQEPENGRRCIACYRHRLDHAARYARDNGFDAFTTTLTISPHKNASEINAAGEGAGIKHSIPFLARDFKKKDGFRRSVELSRSHGLYRQHYCGCEFSTSIASPKEQKL